MSDQEFPLPAPLRPRGLGRRHRVPGRSFADGAGFLLLSDGKWPIVLLPSEHPRSHVENLFGTSFPLSSQGTLSPLLGSSELSAVVQMEHNQSQAGALLFEDLTAEEEKPAASAWCTLRI